MSDPSLPLHKAVRAALVAANVAGGRVYDQVSTGVVTYPMVQVVLSSATPDYDSDDFTDASVDVHILSQAVAGGMAEAYAILSRVRAALDLRPTVTGWACVEGGYTGHNTFVEGDSLTKHIVVSFEYKLLPSA